MRSVKRYKVKEDFTQRNRLVYPAGHIVYEFRGHDYGLARDDTMGTGVVHVSVTEQPDGTAPSQTIPEHLLELAPVESVQIPPSLQEV